MLDPDIEISGGGSQSSRPLDNGGVGGGGGGWGGGGLPQKVFLSLGPRFGLKKMGGGGVAPFSPGSAVGFTY